MTASPARPACTERRRRSMLFIPGNNPGMLCNSVVLGADTLIFDLEDAVALREKDAARHLVRNAIGFIRARGLAPAVEIFVRINALDSDCWREDVTAVVKAGADGILLPKCDSPESVQAVAKALDEEGDTRIVIMALIETALGVERAFDIAREAQCDAGCGAGSGAGKSAGKARLCGLFLGAEDLSADLRAKRSKSGEEINYSRGRLLIAARAASSPGREVQVIDTPFTDVNDNEGMEADAALACRMGFDGKASISPHHVEMINAAFSPTPAEAEWARRVLAAEAQATKEGKGVVSLDGKMVDMPVILRARRIVGLSAAQDAGKGTEVRHG